MTISRIITFALTTSSANILLLAETLASPGVALLTLTAVHVTLARFAISVPGVAVIPRQTGVTVPASSVTEASEALTSDVVTVSAGADVLIRVAPARLAEISNVERIPIVTIGTSLTVSPLISLRTCSTPVLLCGQRVLVVVNGGNLTCGTEVVGRNVQRTFAGLTIIWSAKHGVTIEASGALVTGLADRVVLTVAALEGDGVAGGGVTITVTLVTHPAVESAVDPGVPVVTALAGQAGVPSRTRAPLHCLGAGQDQRPAHSELHGSGV